MSNIPQEISSPLNDEQQTPRAAQHAAPGDLVGTHPVAMSAGAATGGIAAGIATGLAMGTFAGPIGTAVGIAAGAVMGAVGGSLAGKAVAEHINPTLNPTAEHSYWRKHFARRPYTRARTCYEEYAPAYQYGWESQARHLGQTFEQVEVSLKGDWDKIKGTCMLGWEDAKEAVRDAWNRVSKRHGSQ